jgi:uncharacterized protein YecA (UPF0149 family)
VRETSEPRDLKAVAERRGDTVIETDTASVLPEFARKLDACGRLRDAAWKARPRDAFPDAATTIARTTFVRSLKTFNAVLSLCDAGFGEQAAMLCRSLFEDMVVAHWIVEHPEEAGRVDRHYLAQLIRYQEAVAKHGILALTPEIEALSEEDRRDLLSKHGRGLWTGKNVYKMLQEVEQRWDEAERARLWQMHDLAYPYLNLLLHHSNGALLAATHSAGEARYLVTHRPTTRHLAQALDAAFYAFSQLARLVAAPEHRADLDRTIAVERVRMLDLEPAQLRSAGRNDPCPCGSGLKFKRCHGS